MYFVKEISIENITHDIVSSGTVEEKKKRISFVPKVKDCKCKRRTIAGEKKGKIKWIL